jgi:integrase
MRMRLKGINCKTKRLADGSTRTYYWAWKGGPPLRGEPGTPEFIASYNEAVARKVTPPAGLLFSVLAKFQASSDFTDLRERTRRDYIAKIKMIERDFGDLPLGALTDRRMRHEFLAWRDKLAASSRRQADYAWAVLGRILAWGHDRGLVRANPCVRGGRLYRGTRVDKLWSDADEAAFLSLAPKHLHLPLLLALWTGQRQGDLLALPWSAYDGTYIRLRPSKSIGKNRRPVSIQVRAGEPLKAVLDATPKKSTIILVNSRGTPWTEDGFRASWGKACRAANIQEVTFNDLRGSAVTRLAKAGCTEAEIVTITGHSLRSVRAILDTHYLSRDPALGDSAITKLETANRNKK